MSLLSLLCPSKLETVRTLYIISSEYMTIAKQKSSEKARLTTVAHILSLFCDYIVLFVTLIMKVAPLYRV